MIVNAKGRRMATNGGEDFSLNVADQISLTDSTGIHSVEWIEILMGIHTTDLDRSWL